jgi:hypothetical protein
MSKGEDSLETIVVVAFYLNEVDPVYLIKYAYILNLRSIGISTGKITFGSIL